MGIKTMGSAVAEPPRPGRTRTLVIALYYYRPHVLPCQVKITASQQESLFVSRLQGINTYFINGFALFVGGWGSTIVWPYVNLELTEVKLGHYPSARRDGTSQVPHLATHATESLRPQHPNPAVFDVSLVSNA